MAGLHEFPTEPNVAPGLSASATRDIPNRLLARLLARPPQPPRSAGASSGALTIADVQPAGDVVHVFSHIKKTYRVQWVLLEGGDTSPPRARPDNDDRTHASQDWTGWQATTDDDSGRGGPVTTRSDVAAL